MSLPGTMDPDKGAICRRATDFFCCWSNLVEVHFIGIVLTEQVSTLLHSLSPHLASLTMHGCSINHNDIQALGLSRQITHLSHLGLEYNKLSGCGPLLHNALIQAENLKTLNIRETFLNCDDRLGIMYALSHLKYLTTLVMYEKESMLSLEHYEEIIEASCRLLSLKEFYLFPFNYQILENFYRSEIDQMIDNALLKYHRNIAYFY